MWPSAVQLQDELWKSQPLLIWALKLLLNGNFYSWDRKITMSYSSIFKMLF